ncbi:4,4'-diaponeurosporenoate glycosyltransferase [Bhargavaea ginsengi]|uniref:4,4'-diaponeurosporenoate glycosyltransferase n=1 Tax=Bhargavaea ginsengi TaxID=426757 RepID=A0A1H6Z516_9BACL|nr:glycosyltransferase [Bhargavaea ginsengi]SEJ47094.1 4,4'-diaponeurosporenoate glycosyltransferase [Bhargavaea ginsengi]
MLTVLMATGTLVAVLGVLAGKLMLWRFPVPKKHPETSRPSLSVIIPARNEAHRIGPLLESLMDQLYPDMEVIVVDDDSSDRTAEIARIAGARVLRSASAPDGTAGKSAACWMGAAAANGELFLFLDADTRLQAQDSLDKLVSEYGARGGNGLLSVQPYHTVMRPYENLSAVFNLIVMAGMNTFTPARWNLPPAGAFGGCILCSRADYIGTGGHHAIRGELMDDLALGAAFRDSGLPVYCLGGRNVISLRMYPDGIRSLVEGWTKSMASGVSSTHPAVTALVSLWIAGAFMPAATLAAAAWNGMAGWITAGAALYLLYGLEVFRLIRKAGNFRFTTVLLYPFHFLFFTAVFIWSLYAVRIRKRVTWRGRQVDL